MNKQERNELIIVSQEYDRLKKRKRLSRKEQDFLMDMEEYLWQRSEIAEETSWDKLPRGWDWR